MAGISSKAAGGNENKRKFNKGSELQNEEFSDGSGLNWYDVMARTYDAQLGRFMQVDPIADEENQESYSVYHYSYNNPIRYNDPDGKAPTDIIIKGKNNSSVTIKTDLIDVSIDAGSIVGDFGGNYTLEGTDILTATLDIVGIIDQTGVADIAAATLEAKQGNWGSALLSGLGVFPIVGDLGKVGKIQKHLKTINKAIDVVSSAGKKIDLKTMQKVGPSGKPMVHTVKHATQKSAKDAARQGGKGTPVKHTKDKKGGKHYHHGSGVKGKGKGTKGYGSKAGKVSDNVHHEYN
jgi:RHS repeat-associated protein